MADQGQEFFYLDSAGNKQDAELHDPILRAVDFSIDEKVMGPIRARHRAEHVEQQQAKLRAKRWTRVKARAKALVVKGQNDLYKVWNEDDHPRAPAGGPDGGEFVGGGGGDGAGSGHAGRTDSEGAGAGAGNAGRLSQSFSRESPRDAERSRDVVSVYTPTPAAAKAMRAQGHTPLTFHELSGDGGAAQFHAAIVAAKSGKYGAAVHAYEPADYKGMRLFLTADSKDGFALKGDDIVSVFKFPTEQAKGVATTMLALATEQGGRRLDCFDTQLPFLYAKSGFTPVGRLKWDENYKPDGWDKSAFKEFNGGEPDVVFMVHSSTEPQTYTPGASAYVPDYDAGNAAQQAALKPAGDSDATERSTSPYAKDPSSASALLRIEKNVTVNDLYDKVPGSREQDQMARARLRTGHETDKEYKLPNGHYAPDRIPTHRAVVNKLMPPSQVAAATPARGEKPTLYILGGRGGSGKGWFTSKNGTIDPSKAVYINNDDVKEALPEYKGWNAAHLHEEASEIGEAMEQYARDNKLNTIVDATLKSSTSLENRIAMYKNAGYRISGHYMYASPATAATRALGRFVAGNAKNGKGRFVPPEYSLSSTTNEHTFDSHRKDMDYWEVYDNNGDSPVLHSRKG